MSKPSDQPRIANRKARHEYHILESLEVGLALMGSEVKSVRQGKVSLSEGFARVEPATGELWLHDVDIARYENAPAERQHEPKRRRRLLAHRREIDKLLTETRSKGVTLIPLAMYFNSRGLCKLEIGLARGKGKSDKRESMKTKDAKRDMQRAMTRKRIG